MNHVYAVSKPSVPTSAASTQSYTADVHAHARTCIKRSHRDNGYIFGLWLQIVGRAHHPHQHTMPCGAYHLQLMPVSHVHVDRIEGGVQKRGPEQRLSWSPTREAISRGNTRLERILRRCKPHAQANAPLWERIRRLGRHAAYPWTPTSYSQPRQCAWRADAVVGWSRKGHLVRSWIVQRKTAGTVSMQLAIKAHDVLARYCAKAYGNTCTHLIIITTGRQAAMHQGWAAGCILPVGSQTVKRAGRLRDVIWGRIVEAGQPAIKHASGQHRTENTTPHKKAPPLRKLSNSKWHGDGTMGIAGSKHATHQTCNATTMRTVCKQPNFDVACECGG